MESTPTRKRRSGIQRYAPFIIVVVVIAAIVLIAGNRNGGDSGGGSDDGGADQGSKSNTELIEAGPMCRSSLAARLLSSGSGSE